MEGVKDTTLDAFANIASLIAATTIGKRVIVRLLQPLLQTRQKNG